MFFEKLPINFIYSLLLHVLVLTALIISYHPSAKNIVLENTPFNKNIIQATAVPMPNLAVTKTPPLIKKIVPQPQVIPPKKDVIAIKPTPIKKILPKVVNEKHLLQEMKKLAALKKIQKEQLLEKSFARELKETTAKSLQQDLLNEQTKASKAKTQGEVNRYKALILQSIAQRWLVPASSDKTRSAELMIHIAPGGEVLDVTVTRSSGDVALDRSARDAVFKASPLPVPQENNAFNEFRQFVLKVRPENVVPI